MLKLVDNQPREPFNIGDRVRTPTLGPGRHGVVIGIDDDFVWVRHDNGHRNGWHADMIEAAQ